jgi:hypothetical protein
MTLPNGGKSKAARSKQNRTLGAVFNQATKVLGQDKVTPNRYRTEGMNNAIKQVPTLPNPYELLYGRVAFGIDYFLLKLNQFLQP